MRPDCPCTHRDPCKSCVARANEDPRGLLPIADRVAATLTDKGTPGTFTAAEGPESDLVTWHGARRHRGEAHRALLKALADAGHDAENCGFAVRVSRLERSVNDHEAALHNVEPDSRSLRECLLEAAAAE